MPKPPYTLAAIAEHIGATLEGDHPDTVIESLAPLDKAQAGQVSFLNNKTYLAALKTTQASAVIVSKKDVENCPTPCLISDNPYFSFAKATELFAIPRTAITGIHPTAIIGEACDIPDSVSIGPYAIIGDHVTIGENSVIGPHCHIGDRVQLGAKSYLYSNVHLYYDTVIGDFATIHSGAVIGADGFGFANNKDQWQKIYQLGKVVIGHHADIGANTCVDRGALHDTTIGNHVIIDNLVQVAHNVKIGHGSAVAGCTGIAGSVEIGNNCLIGGHVAFNGHIKICDNATILGSSTVHRDVTEPEVYASATTIMPFKRYLKTISYFHKLPEMMRKLGQLEKHLLK